MLPGIQTEGARMKQLKEIPQAELSARIENIIRNMGVELLDHNKIGYEHIRQFAELLIRCEGQNTEIFKNLARTRICISERYLLEYYRAFISWEVFRVHDKKIIMTDQENSNNGNK